MGLMEPLGPYKKDRGRIQMKEDVMTEARDWTGVLMRPIMSSLSKLGEVRQQILTKNLQSCQHRDFST